jgi:hypothetical protein
MRLHFSRAYLSAAYAALFVCVLASSVFAQAPDPHLGVWKLNLAKSKYDPGPAPKSATSTWEVVAAGTKVSTDGIAADGTPRRWESITKYDGKDSPITGANPEGDTVARTRVDERTVRSVTKKGGKVTITQTSVVSPDGKTRTVTTTGVNAAGQKVNNIAVYERQ